MADASRAGKEGQKSNKGKLKKPPPLPKKAPHINASARSAMSSGSSSPVLPVMDADTMAAFPTGEPRPQKQEIVVCIHCKKNVTTLHAAEHIAGCLKSKQEKARRKKEAREAAAARAKAKADKGGDGKDDDVSDSDGRHDTTKPTKSTAASARKSTTKTSTTAAEESKKGKKRKADAGEDDAKAGEPKKKKNKKDEPKAKPVPKPKGPVDVEKQCGVILPNGAKCARSLTCKSHSMGAKRAVPGRSLPYDMLLQAYQKKNQARQQKAAISANAPALFDSDPEDASNMAGGAVDSDTERDAIMSSLARTFNPEYLHSVPVYQPPPSISTSTNSNNPTSATNNIFLNNFNTGPARGPQPLAARTHIPAARKYQLVRMKELLSNAMSGNRGSSIFAVSDQWHNHGHSAGGHQRQGYLAGAAASGSGGGGGGGMGTDGFAIPSAVNGPSTAGATAGEGNILAEAQRRMSGMGSMGKAPRRPSVVSASAD